MTAKPSARLSATHTTSAPSVVLGIDPGLATLGYGAVSYSSHKSSCVTYGCVTTTTDTDFANRLSLIYQGVLLLIDTHRPTYGAIEKLFFSKNTKTALAVAQARGVAILAFAQRAVPLFEFTPLEIKQAVTGYGRADKKQVQQMVRSLLCLKTIPRPDDAADALAVALCAGATAKFQ